MKDQKMLKVSFVILIVYFFFLFNKFQSFFTVDELQKFRVYPQRVDIKRINLIFIDWQFQKKT